MRQVIYRRGWCPQCQQNTVQCAQVRHDDGAPIHETVTCTECQTEIHG